MSAIECRSVATGAVAGRGAFRLDSEKLALSVSVRRVTMAAVVLQPPHDVRNRDCRDHMCDLRNHKRDLRNHKCDLRNHERSLMTRLRNRRRNLVNHNEPPPTKEPMPPQRPEAPAEPISSRQENRDQIEGFQPQSPQRAEVLVAESTSSRLGPKVIDDRVIDDDDDDADCDQSSALRGSQEDPRDQGRVSQHGVRGKWPPVQLKKWKRTDSQVSRFRTQDLKQYCSPKDHQ